MNDSSERFHRATAVAGPEAAARGAESSRLFRRLTLDDGTKMKALWWPGSGLSVSYRWKGFLERRLWASNDMEEIRGVFDLDSDTYGSAEVLDEVADRLREWATLPQVRSRLTGRESTKGVRGWLERASADTSIRDAVLLVLFGLCFALTSLWGLIPDGEVVWGVVVLVLALPPLAIGIVAVLREVTTKRRKVSFPNGSSEVDGSGTASRSFPGRKGARRTSWAAGDSRGQGTPVRRTLKWLVWAGAIAWVLWQFGPLVRAWIGF